MDELSADKLTYKIQRFRCRTSSPFDLGMDEAVGEEPAGQA